LDLILSFDLNVTVPLFYLKAHMSFFKVTNEYGKLNRVILGTPLSFGGTPNLNSAYDPKSKIHISNGTFPTQESITNEMNNFSSVLENIGIEVLKPKTLDNYNQIFSRDIACVIDDKICISNMISERSREIEAVQHILENYDEQQILRASDDVRFEGGDVMPHNEYIFIGYSKADDFKRFKVSRTNDAGVEFFRSHFPSKEIKAFELSKSDTDPRENALHLDCCFQPFGLGHAIIHKEGFKNQSDVEWLTDLIGIQNCLFISKEQMFNMGANLFSVAPDHVISEKNFSEINEFLENNGYKVTTVNYSEISKMEGLLRCSTLPLNRD